MATSVKLNPELLNWLLERSQPAVRYRTFLDLLGCSSESREVQVARANIVKIGWAHDVLKTQESQGHWESRRNLYLQVHGNNLAFDRSCGLGID